MLDWLRKAVQHRFAQRVGLLQPVERTPGARAGYEQAMAKHVESIDTDPSSVVLVLVGNIHASTEARMLAGKSYVPMAGWLPPQQTITLNIVGHGGSAWDCFGPPTGQSACGPKEFGAQTDAPRGVVMASSPVGGYSGWVNLGSTNSASPPAVADQSNK